MMGWVDEIVEDLQRLPDVEEVAIADEVGTYLSGCNNDKPDEFAATLTYVGQAGSAIQETMSFESFEHVILSGNKQKLLVYLVGDRYLGLRLSPKAVVSRLQGQIQGILESANLVDA